MISLLLILHMANVIIPSLGDWSSVDISGVSTGWGDGIGSIWWPLVRIVFKKAKTVQVVRLPTAGTAASSLWADLLPNFHRRIQKSVTVWNTSSEFFSHDIRRTDHVDDEALNFLLFVGSDFLHQLADSQVWFSHSNYIVLVENHSECSTNFDFTFRGKALVVPRLYFVSSSCPQFAYIVEPDVSNSSVMLSKKNVTSAMSRWDRSVPKLWNSTWRVAMFQRYPTAVITQKSKQKWRNFEGIDGFFLKTISDHYKMEPVLVFPEDGQTYGAYENGTASGTLGIVLRGEADIALNGRFLIDYGTSEIDFTSPYLSDKLCIMAPRSRRVPSYIAMFRCFDYPSWILLLLAYIVGSFVWSFIVCSPDSQKHVRRKETASRDVYFMILAGQVSKSSPETFSARIFIASCLLFSVVFMGAFQGLLYKSMTKPTFYPQLDTLDDVDRSGLPVVTGSPSLKDAFPGDDEDPLIKRLRSKLYVVRDEAAWNKIKEDESNYATLWRQNGAFLRLHHFGYLKLHLVEECPRSYFLSFLLQKKSPYLNTVNSFITRCHEHGLLQLWRDRTYKFTAKHLHYMQDFNRQLGVELEEIQAPFFVLCLGLLVSVLVFLYERASRLEKKKRVVATPITWWRYAHHSVKRLYGELFLRQHSNARFSFTD